MKLNRELRTDQKMAEHILNKIIIGRANKADACNIEITVRLYCLCQVTSD